MKPSRRTFLLALGVGTAAAVAATAAKKPAASPSLAGEGKRATRGYQASAHVTNYYRTTKV
jgi:Spy/CpxP family protein refolding chaperone